MRAAPARDADRAAACIFLAPRRTCELAGGARLPTRSTGRRKRSHGPAPLAAIGGAHRAGQHDRVRAPGGGGARRAAARLRRAQGLVGRAARSCSGRRSGDSPGCSASRPWQRRAGRWRADARRQLVRRRRAQFRREPAAPPRRPPRDHRLDRGRPAARAELPRAVPARSRSSPRRCGARASARATGWRR